MRDSAGNGMKRRRGFDRSGIGQPALRRGMRTAGQVDREPSADRVQVDIGHARQYRRVVEQRLAFEPGLPEVAGAAVLAIRAPHDRLVQEAHEPRQTAQPFAQRGDSVGVTGQRGGARVAGGFIDFTIHTHWRAFADRHATAQVEPASRCQRPSLARCRATSACGHAQRPKKRINSLTIR
jgi:hypothetical protein